MKKPKIIETAFVVSQAVAANPDDSERYEQIPEHLRSQLMGFQVEGVKFALQAGGRALIGDEMGLGKTVQAIAIMSCYRDEWPCLIVCPASLKGRPIVPLMLLRGGTLPIGGTSFGARVMSTLAAPIYYSLMLFTPLFLK